MSRHLIQPKDPTNFSVVVGYDPPLDFYFADVYSTAPDAEAPVFQVEGTIDLLEIRNALKPYADLPVAVARELNSERTNRDKLPANIYRDHRPIPQTTPRGYFTDGADEIRSATQHLDAQERKRIESAIDGIGTEAGEIAFAELLANVRQPGGYAKRWLHDIEHLTKDSDGYVRWRDVAVDHYSYPDDDDGIAREATAAARLAGICRAIESRGEVVSLSGVRIELDLQRTAVKELEDRRLHTTIAALRLFQCERERDRVPPLFFQESERAFPGVGLGTPDDMDEWIERYVNTSSFAEVVGIRKTAGPLRDYTGEVIHPAVLGQIRANVVASLDYLGEKLVVPARFRDIATDGGRVAPLNPDEIKALMHDILANRSVERDGVVDVSHLPVFEPKPYDVVRDRMPRYFERDASEDLPVVGRSPDGARVYCLDGGGYRSVEASRLQAAPQQGQFLRIIRLGDNLEVAKVVAQDAVLSHEI